MFFLYIKTTYIITNILHILLYIPSITENTYISKPTLPYPTFTELLGLQGIKTKRKRQSKAKVEIKMDAAHTHTHLYTHINTKKRNKTHKKM